MISGDREIISQLVHHPDDLRTLGNGSERGPLNGVPGIYEKNMVILCFKLFLIEGESVIADPVLIPCSSRMYSRRCFAPQVPSGLRGRIGHIT